MSKDDHSDCISRTELARLLMVLANSILRAPAANGAVRKKRGKNLALIAGLSPDELRTAQENAKRVGLR